MGSTYLPPTFDPREELGALAAHAGICAGGEEQSSSLPRPSPGDRRTALGSPNWVMGSGGNGHPHSE